MTPMRGFLFVLLTFSGLPSVAAQTPPRKTTVRPPPDPPPALIVRVQDRSVPLQLTRVNAEVTIVGHLAETELTMTFYNPNRRAMEGDLYVPLPQGATVSSYALDVRGTLVEGVVVARDKGRQVFEAEVRKGIDPGLIEWTRENNFKTRIFPIPGRGSRTVRVGYVTEVVDSARGATYHLPLNFRDRVESFSLRLEVVKAAAKPLVVKGGPKGLGFVAARDSYVAQTTLKNLTLTEDLAVALPDIDKKPVRVETAPDGNVYFAIRHPVAPPRTTGTRARPRRIAIYWDASMSRATIAHSAEIAVLEAYFDSLASRAGTGVVVDLVIVRNRAEAARRFQLPRQRGALVAALRAVKYDGGTQLGSMGTVKGADLNLVFSDGVSNFGENMPRRLGAPTYVINQATTANHAFLRYLAMSTGGAYFNLRRVRTADVVAGIGKRAFSFISARADGAELDSLYPTLRVPVHGVFTLAGKLKAARATVTLSYGVGNRVLHRQTFTVQRSDATRGDLLRRYWAQKKVADLLVFPDDNEQAIIDVGRRHSIVTPGTSLLVLERLEQYVEHEVRPPASLAAMRRQYDDTMRRRLQIARDREAEKLTSVIAMWEKRKAWWNKTYNYPRNFRYRDGHPQKPAARNSNRRRPSVAPPRPAEMAQEVADLEAPMADEQNDEAPAGQATASKTEKKKDRGGSSHTSDPSVVLKPWDPDTPYLKALKSAPAGRRFAVYLAQRELFGASPAFYLDSADFFQQRKNTALAVQILSNLAELDLENPALLRVLAHRLAQLGHLGMSARVFEEVLKLRPEEPQSYRDLALILSRRAAKRSGEQARSDYARAMELLARVVMGEWARFSEIEVIALTELNNILPRARRAGMTRPPVDKRLLAHLDMDIRIVMTWDADLTDMDLHVIEPSGEEAYYSHNRTTIGGMVSRDFTRGYGPEVYAVRRAMKGRYTIKTKFFGSSAARLIGAVTLQVDIYTNYGRRNQKRKSLTLRLTEKKETFEVGSIVF